jgi:trans-aconitate 2-methyltransferase
LASPAYRQHAPGWTDPWEFASPEETARRLAAAGFRDVETSLEAAPTGFPDASSYREFVTSVVLRAHLDALGDESTRQAFMTEITNLASDDDPPFTLDYWRLNMSAVRPLAS